MKMTLASVAGSYSDKKAWAVMAQRMGAYEGKWRDIAALVATLADAVQHAQTNAGPSSPATSPAPCC